MIRDDVNSLATSDIDDALLSIETGVGLERAEQVARDCMHTGHYLLGFNLSNGEIAHANSLSGTP